MTQHKNILKLFQFEEEEMQFSLFRFLRAKGLLMIPKLKISKFYISLQMICLNLEKG